jgi:mRNA-degrading endonuclease RelE of RelBE toxin-antitoxin system
MKYTITFTRGFADEIKSIPKDKYPIVTRQIKALEADPFAKNPQAIRMKNECNTFRVKIGSHIRMLYKVESKAHRVELFGIGSREGIYKGHYGSENFLPAEEATNLRSNLEGEHARESLAPIVNKESNRTANSIDVSANRTPDPITNQDSEVEIEILEWVTVDDLFLMKVPEKYWSKICQAQSLTKLRENNIPINWVNLIEDYLTTPSMSQIEKLYVLDPDHEVDSILEKPLSHFLVELDPDQKAALKKFKSGGP